MTITVERPRAWDEIVDVATRREFIVGGVSLAALLAVGCGDDATDAEGDGAEGWTFTDDRGVEVSLPKRPERIAAYVGTAAVLWDFGLRPVGVFGPQRQADGSPEPAAGLVDLDAVESVGDTWDGVNLEALAALAPDLVVTGGVSAEDLWVIGADQLDDVERVAPLVTVQAYDKPASEIIAGYERLAVALGADKDAPAVEQARDDLAAATTRLEEALAAKPGLLAITTYAAADGLYVARVEDFPDLAEFHRLGLDLVDPEGSEDYWEMLSWENADRYPADLILHDGRSYSLQPDVLAADYPTWATLPAVRAGQIHTWNAETVLSHRGFAEAVAALTDTITSARADVV